MKIKFLGAAQNVTGSRFLLSAGGKRILVDCGLYQERDFRHRNWEDFPVDPAAIDLVLLTHAHIDHSGYLPKFVAEGFKGKIYCTPPTAEISAVALLDSAKIQEEDAEYKRRRHRREKRKSRHPELALYTVEDAEKTVSRFHSIPYLQPFSLGPEITAAFHDAGHILGSAMVELKIKEEGREKIVVFSGDIGRSANPLLDDPSVFPRADVVVMESTYGNRLHEKSADALEKLRRIIVETSQSGGNVVIPSFAIERTQELIYYLHTLLQADKIPHLMVFVDSPMAIKVTRVYSRHPDYLDQENKALNREGGKTFRFPLLTPTRTAAESKAINHIKGSSIILAGSGMCTGGRIKHHLAHNIDRPESTLLFVGYQARGTLGRILLERPKKVRILGRTYPVRARIEKINGFSAHADKNELLTWLGGFSKPPQKVFIVHGEEEAARSLAAAVREKINGEVNVPAYLEEFAI